MKLKMLQKTRLTSTFEGGNYLLAFSNIEILPIDPDFFKLGYCYQKTLRLSFFHEKSKIEMFKNQKTSWYLILEQAVGNWLRCADYNTNVLVASSASVRVGGVPV